MLLRKIGFLISVFIFCGLSVNAQQNASYLIEDSSKYNKTGKLQLTEFKQHENNFPPKPRTQWEAGIGIGHSTIHGDVSSLGYNPAISVGLRKSLGYLVSVRLGYSFSKNRGLQWKVAENYNRNTPWITAGYKPAYILANGIRVGAEDYVYYNYETKINHLSAEFLLSLGNTKFHKSNVKLNYYVVAGFGVAWYQTKLDVTDKDGQPYPFNTILLANYSTRKETRKEIKTLMDGVYETKAQEDNNRYRLFDKPTAITGNVGGGISYKLSKRINLFAESRIIFTNTDLLDGQQWAEQSMGDAVQTRNLDALLNTTAGINVNIGNPKKRVEPLYWINPLEYIYSEVSRPRHMKLPKPVLTDDDGDGVTNQFDLEPSTPAGCPVDVHGVSRDTDGDGVPDCRDKELITATRCQPVDIYGIGKCPVDTSAASKCCEETRRMLDAKNCGLYDLPVIVFASGSSKLLKDNLALLSGIAEQIRNNPNCFIEIIGYPEDTKKSRNLSFNRVKNIIRFLVEKEGISPERFTSKYKDQFGDINTIDLNAVAKY